MAALSLLIENSCLLTDGARPAVHSSIFLSNNADFVEATDFVEVEAGDNTYYHASEPSTF